MPPCMGPHRNGEFYMLGGSFSKHPTLGSKAALSCFRNNISRPWRVIGSLCLPPTTQTENLHLDSSSVPPGPHTYHFRFFSN
eukprot:jgi/Botrbrau1/18271/Bobra.0179s0005.1